MSKKPILRVIIIINVLLPFFIFSNSFLSLGREQIRIISEPQNSAIAGVPYRYQVNIEDVDMETGMEYELTNAPEGMIIERSTGLIKWIPMEDQKGDYEIIISVGNDLYEGSQEFKLTVSRFQLKSISVRPIMMYFEGVEGIQNIESVTARYTNDTNKKIDIEKSIFESSNTEIVKVDDKGKVTPVAFGTATIQISYSEGNVTKSARIDVNVKNPIFDCG